MKISRKKLLIENDYDFLLFGISCGEKPYRLCWALNRQLGTSFSKDKDMEVQEKNQSIPTKFPVFVCHNHEMFTEYRIILNKSENKFLVPEFRQADYLLMVQSSSPSVEKNYILKKLKEITFVQTAFEINSVKIKSRNNFLF